ncbi:polymeric immunoglobulin receptor-like [Xiphophorus maculatus]|uniref:polymeric immunoglobulin receptor-like n=1 Tax=Xiphophorus maculatus TaxID=8083 RepID=UPI000C6E5DE3|nr:polymeric immunoglobulin receptor-like [Xiphophorus maculatus]
MWSFKNLQVCICFALSCVSSAAAVIHVSGYEGKTVTVPCPYYAGFESYEKYLCRSDCRQDADVLVKSTEATKGRYSTSDDRRKLIFMTTISNLSSKDEGRYWCGVTKVGFDKYPSEVSLKVKKEWCCVKTNKMSGIVGTPVMLSCPYPPKHRNNRKFLCKGDHRDNCTDVVTGGSRFTLQDNVSSSSFLVIVTKLEEGDTGTYWCGSDSTWSPEKYTKIELSAEWCCVQTQNISGNVGYPLTFSCPQSRRRQDSRKFLCKGDHRRNCTDMLSQRRFTLQDDESSKKIFVMVTKLEDSDVGTYWCGSDSKWSAGNYTKIELSLEWCCVKTEKMRGIVGNSFILSCPYPPQHWNNDKFLCKGEQRDSCTDVLSQSRFTLQEDESSGFYLVKITKLEEGDAGTYWCGSDSKWSAGNYTKIELAVGPASLKLLIYIAPALLLALLFAVFIAYTCKQREAEARKDKKRRKFDSLQMISVKPEDFVYENSSLVDKAEDVQEQLYENLKATTDAYSVYM